MKSNICCFLFFHHFTLYLKKKKRAPYTFIYIGFEAKCTPKFKRVEKTKQHSKHTRLESLFFFFGWLVGWLETNHVPKKEKIIIRKKII